MRSGKQTEKRQVSEDALATWRETCRELTLTTAQEKTARAREDLSKVSGYEIAVVIGEFLEGMVKDKILAYEIANRLWRHVTNYIREALIEGRAVNFYNVCSLIPYVKKGRRYRHPETGKMQSLNERWYVRLTLSPNLKKDLQ